MAETNAYLTIRFEGSEVRPGRMRLDDFIQATREFSACAKRVAMVLQQSPSAARGRRPEELVEAISLDIIGFTRGSPAAVAQFERSENQLGLEGLDFGEQTYRAVRNERRTRYRTTAIQLTGRRQSASLTNP